MAWAYNSLIDSLRSSRLCKCRARRKCGRKLLHSAHGPIGVVKTRMIEWAIDPETHNAAIRHADIGTEHVVTIVGFAKQQVKRRATLVSIA